MAERDYSNDPYADPNYDPNQGTGQNTTGATTLPNETNPLKGPTPPRPARPGYQWVKSPISGEWEEHSTVDEVADNPADRPGYVPPGGPNPSVYPPPDIGGGPKTTPPPASGGSMGGPTNFDPYESAGPFQPRRDTFNFTPFSYDPYTASSWEDAEKEPGYDVARKQLRSQIESGAAGRGMLRSGMTLKDIYTGLDSLGQQNFSNFDNRRFRNYSANREGAFQTWGGNLGADAQKFALEYGVDRDVYDRAATNADRKNTYGLDTTRSMMNDALQRWQEQVRSLTNIAVAGNN